MADDEFSHVVYLAPQNNNNNFYFVGCYAVFLCRIVSNWHDSAFALSDLMIAVMGMIIMMVYMQMPPGYQHLCRTLDIYTSRWEYFFVVMNEGTSMTTGTFQWLSSVVNRHFCCSCGCCCSLLYFYNDLLYFSLICNLSESFLLAVGEILWKNFPSSILL